MDCAWCGEPMVTEAGAWVHASDRTRFRFEGNPPHIAGDRQQPLDGPEGPMEEMDMAKGKKKVESVVAPEREAAAEAEAMQKAKVTKKAAKKRETKEKIPLRTLALRVTNEEFDLVHKAAGPRNVSGFMKSTILAAAQRSLSK